MLRRHLSPELIKALNDSPFWNNICADHELQPEIRDGCGARNCLAGIVRV